MATSDSFNYSVNFTNVLTEALEQIGVLSVGETISSDDQTSCLRTFNMMVKQWSGNFDFAPGLKEFSKKTGYVFMQKNQGVYSLGQSGDNATLSYVQTTMRVAGENTDTTLEITDTTGITTADIIGIVLDTGTVHWDTVASVTDGDTLVLDTGLTGAAAIGKVIYAYTTKIIRPLYVETGLMRDTDTNDFQMTQMRVDSYESIPVKGADGFPLQYAYANTLTNGTLSLDVEPSDVNYVMRITFLALAEDYDAAVDDIAYPQEWYMALALGLSKLIAPKFQQGWTELNESNFVSALSMARTSYAETTDFYFQPGID